MASQLLIARRKISNTAFVGFCWVAAAVALAFLAMILWSLIEHGLGALNLQIFTMDTPAPGSPGGLRNAIIGSVEMCAIAMVLAVGFGVLAGTWLAEYAGDSAYGKVVRFVNDVLLSAPSILIGLFVYYVLVQPFHGFSGLAGSVALALLATPVVTRTTEDVMKLQPPALREAGVALGSPLASAIRRILWRASSTGILTGGLLAFARISGETAPLLFTALNNQFFSLDLTKPTANLPSVIFNDALSAYDDLVRLAWAGAALIAFTVLLVNIIARTLARETRRS
ncbi:MAG TPA: phosphate ABC transporter permease PstA [Caulobacteraceae bacterium]|nr:phosphate ABC transporter permease PstA [Caulobacteraceae bacterium]